MGRSLQTLRRAAVPMLFVALALIAGCKRGSSSSSSTAGESTYVDPWKARLDEMTREYKANEAKLLNDWRTAMNEVNSGDLDADRLSRQISDMVRVVGESTAKLESWDRELRGELAQRPSAGGTR